MKLKSIISCPKCGFQKEESMPTDSCQHFYKCSKCGEMLKSKEGDCCVFCSYGTINVHRCRKNKTANNALQRTVTAGFRRRLPAGELERYMACFEGRLSVYGKPF